jgi:hypothetical protein
MSASIPRWAGDKDVFMALTFVRWIALALTLFYIFTFVHGLLVSANSARPSGVRA